MFFVALLFLGDGISLANSPQIADNSSQQNLYAVTMTTSPEDIRLAIRQARECWINGDAAVFASLFTTDGEFIVPGSKLTGREAIRQVAADFAAGATDVTITIHRILIDGAQAAVEWHWEDTEKATGRRNRADDVIMVDFVDGQISRWREYIDSQTPAAS